MQNDFDLENLINYSKGVKFLSVKNKNFKDLL
jgi:hypothetical protein